MSSISIKRMAECNLRQVRKRWNQDQELKDCFISTMAPGDYVFVERQPLITVDAKWLRSKNYLKIQTHRLWPYKAIGIKPDIFKRTQKRIENIVCINLPTRHTQREGIKKKYEESCYEKIKNQGTGSNSTSSKEMSYICRWPHPATHQSTRQNPPRGLVTKVWQSAQNHQARQIYCKFSSNFYWSRLEKLKSNIIAKPKWKQHWRTVEKWKFQNIHSSNEPSIVEVRCSLGLSRKLQGTVMETSMKVE